MQLEELANGVKTLQLQKAAVEKRIANAESDLGQAVKDLTKIAGALEYAQALYSLEAKKVKEAEEKEKLTT